jgi:hypothetical protein
MHALDMPFGLFLAMMEKTNPQLGKSIFLAFLKA